MTSRASGASPLDTIWIVVETIIGRLRADPGPAPVRRAAADRLVVIR
jgi:hypothetical protein